MAKETVETITTDVATAMSPTLCMGDLMIGCALILYGVHAVIVATDKLSR